MKQTLRKLTGFAFSLLFWFALWYVVAEKVFLSFLLPNPLEVLKRLLEFIGTQAFYEILGASLVRVGLGYAAGILCGILLGSLAFRFGFLHTLFAPLMAIIRATPVASFILVVILWIDREGVPSFISFLMVFPIVWQNTLLGWEKRDRQLGEMATVFSLSAPKTLLRIDLPQILPYVFASAKTGMGLAWKAGVAAEVLALPKVSVGQMIYNAKLYLETVDLYAWTLAIILISVLLEKLFSTAVSKGRRRFL